jgi:hypothetical protein
MIEFTPAEVTLLLLITSLPILLLAILLRRRHSPAPVTSDRPNPWVRPGDPGSELGWGDIPTGQQGER